MSMLSPGEDPSTRVARALSRRRFLDRSLKGITAAAVGLITTGTIMNGTAAADEEGRCPCAPLGPYCDDCPPGQHGKRCPTGYRRCKIVDGEMPCHGCVYEDASWVSCTGLGQGLGYRLCTDCWAQGDCRTLCGCKSNVICRHCQTPADVKAEMALIRVGDD